MRRLAGELLFNTILSAVLAFFTVVIADALGYQLTYWHAWVFWFVLCVFGWAIIIVRRSGDDHDDSSSGEGFWKSLGDGLSGNW